MDSSNFLLNSWIWLRRFRHRKGYGVHSPFAFNLITFVIYEKLFYYVYKTLADIRKKILNKYGYKSKQLNTQKVDKLLFRLINYIQPENILEVGTHTGLSTLYLASAKKEVPCYTFDFESADNKIAQQLFNESKLDIRFSIAKTEENIYSLLHEIKPLNFILFNQKEVNKELWDYCMKKAHSNSLYVITGIYDSKEMAAWWKEIIADKYTGITFDLYHIGLVFFDKTKIKQHYIINF